ncbi:MAG: tRNA pseudouridine55 synthase [Flavobacteriales bacterium]|jgi:tRNA pseudouridine55 synthase
MSSVTDMDFKEGAILLINKPLRWTSFDVVKKVRYALRHIYGQKKFKVGHAGTLDPLATGLLVLCTGKKTKEIDGFIQDEKEYVATIKFGATTPSFDLETKIDETFPTEHITEAELITAIATFEGEQEQVPPIFSAKKIDGRRAYKSARKGKEVVMRMNFITIHKISLLSYENLIAKVHVVCSKGTYIRSLANDLGKKMNSGAHLIDLERTRSGNFLLENAYDLFELVDEINALPRILEKVD